MERPKNIFSLFNTGGQQDSQHRQLFDFNNFPAFPQNNQHSQTEQQRPYKEQESTTTPLQRQIPSFIQQPHIQTQHSNILAPLPQLKQSEFKSRTDQTDVTTPSIPSMTMTFDMETPSPTSQNKHTPNGSDTTTPISASNGKGVTAQIRTQLNFTNPLKWKKFTNRRLELIDKFNLSSRKASEQDNLILKIADILRTEFGYQEDTLHEFDKLVRAAVQSVRRNRKRLAKLSEMKQDERSAFMNNQSSVSKASEESSSSNTQNLPNFINYETSTSEIPGTNNNNSRESSNNSSTNNTNVTNSPVVPLSSLCSHTMKLPPITSKHFPQDPFNFSETNKKKLLNYITNSSTFFKLIDAPRTINEDILMTLGQNSVNATISFTLEKIFVTVHQTSLNYLYAKLTTMENLSHFFKSLEINNSSSQSVHLLSANQSMNLLFKIVGCLIKDYGFDTICYTLGELFHELILLEYPLYISKQATSTHQKQQLSSIIPLLPLDPKEADKEIQKEITITYRAQSMHMKFKPLSSTPPTYLELLDNCRVLFNVSDKALRLRIVGEDISDIAEVFSDLKKMKVLIEIYEV